MKNPNGPSLEDVEAMQDEQRDKEACAKTFGGKTLAELRAVIEAAKPPIAERAQIDLECFAVEALPSLLLAAESSERLAERVKELEAVINTPEFYDFAKAIPLEAAHQLEKWGQKHDDGKTVWDWFWLVGYLAQKAAHAAEHGDQQKALHHTITTAAALCNWHAQMLGKSNMRPGIQPPHPATEQREGV